jgi:hypothetical protein
LIGSDYKNAASLKNTIWRCDVSKMSLIEKVFFISAWVVAGCSVLALILSPIALRHNGLQAIGSVLDWMAVGITGCFAFLHISGWFRNNMVMFIMAWVVGGLVLLSMILTAAANLGGVGTVAVLFEHIALLVLFTLILLHLSGKLTKSNQAEKAEPKTPKK